MTDQPPLGPNEADALRGNDPYVVARARQMDADRAAADAAKQDTVVVNGKPWQPDQPVPEAKPAAAHAKPEAAPAPTDNLKPPMVLGDREPAPVSEWIADIRKTGEGYAALEQWPEHAENIPFAAASLANVVNSMPADHADLWLGAVRELQELRPAAYVSLLKAFASNGRQISTIAGDYRSIGKANIQQKGDTKMAEHQFTGDRATLEAEHTRLTAEYHNLMERGDRSGAKKAFDRRTALSGILWPNTTKR